MEKNEKERKVKWEIGQEKSFNKFKLREGVFATMCGCFQVSVGVRVSVCNHRLRSRE